MGWVRDLMAKRCEACPLCRHARQHPQSLFGRAMAWHGKFCPFWRAWQRVYGDQRKAQEAGGR